MTTTVKPLSRKLAEQALEAVKQQFSSYIAAGYDGPKLVEEWHEGHWAVCWAEGPYEWAMRCPEGDIDEELSILAGKRMDTPAAKNWPVKVHGSPYYPNVLVLYPNN